MGTGIISDRFYRMSDSGKVCRQTKLYVVARSFWKPFMIAAHSKNIAVHTLHTDTPDTLFQHLTLHKDPSWNQYISQYISRQKGQYITSSETIMWWRPKTILYCIFVTSFHTIIPSVSLVKAMACSLRLLIKKNSCLTLLVTDFAHFWHYSQRSNTDRMDMYTNLTAAETGIERRH